MLHCSNADISAVATQPVTSANPLFGVDTSSAASFATATNHAVIEYLLAAFIRCLRSCRDRGEYPPFNCRFSPKYDCKPSLTLVRIAVDRYLHL